MAFNEDTRVKIPAILHLCRLGYEYLSLKNPKPNSLNYREEDTNIFTNIFIQSLQRINSGVKQDTAERLYTELSLDLENEDLGKAFYEKITNQSGVKYIDFKNFDNNSFHVVTELTYKNGEDEFRPDIIVLINGMPLVFIEVKKPNNKDGILAERKRIVSRFQNKKFRKFVNLTQMMIFSNNMEYDDVDPEPLQGAFYASTSYQEPAFNYFREEEKFDLKKMLLPNDDEMENFVLKDNNYNVIKTSREFATNKNPDTPTNRISTSLLSRDRLKFILQYSLAYVNEPDGLQKHIMRYPQMFATKAIRQTLDDKKKKGIIWHTQGSGKTALAYYNVKYLTNYFAEKGIIPKFYFITDRLDLSTQAKGEFTARGLTVHVVNSRNEFLKELKTTTALHGSTGKAEITVVNIQKFQEDKDLVSTKDYDINIQRIYFLDEVHRSYNPKGSFLANLTQSDPGAITIGLTGTPLLSAEYNSTTLFGGYIHKYYYNASIADGYTLRLIREQIETEYRLQLEEILRKIQVLQRDLPRRRVYAHPKFVRPMLKYIVDDFEKFRVAHGDSTTGAMVVCDSSDQAKEMFDIFNLQYVTHQDSELALQIAADGAEGLNKDKSKTVKRAALILHDIGDKTSRKKQVEDFKAGKIDLLFVYNMLLTGFDAKRLKKIYLGRVIRRHNLLQTLTRVNRTYKDYRFGHVVDFADISAEFAATNKAYFDELRAEHGDEIEHYSNLFLSQEEKETAIAEIKEFLFDYDIKNKELFSQQITKISDRKKMLEIVKVLRDTKSLYNLIRLSGDFEMLEKLDFRQLSVLSREAENHLQLLNAKEALENSTDTTNLLNLALEDIVFMFTKVGQAELILADQLKDTLRKTREALRDNFDQKDPEFITLHDALKKLFGKNKLSEVTQDDMRNNIKGLQKMFDKITELNRTNDLLKAKYDNDEKYARIHKRMAERGTISKSKTVIYNALQDVKEKADEKVVENSDMLLNEPFFEAEMMQLILHELMTKNKIKLNTDTSRYVNNLVVKEYLNEYHGISSYGNF